MEFAIGIGLSTFLAYYPIVTQTSATVGTPPKVKYTVTMSDPGGSLGSELNGWVTELKNMDVNYTTCCIQMSHAINMSFHTIDPKKMVGIKSYRRQTRGFKIASVANKEFHYIASVDEMKEFLDTTFGGGEEISSRGDGKVASLAEAQASVQGRPGIVVFMNNQSWGFHTEVWTGTDWHQGWMKGKTAPFGWRRVWFWDMGVARDDKLPMV
jgi:hypothetical protein